MQRGFGAILTTGLALVGATVIVANPVSAPPSDVRVPPVKLSADNTTSSAAVDQALLDAIESPAEATPANLFKKSVAGVVTNVTLLSGRAVETAMRVRPVVDGTPAPAPPVPPLGVVDLLGGTPVDVAAAKAPVAPVDDPGLQHAVSSVADYVGYVSVRAVEATDVAGRNGTGGPKRIADTLAQLAHGDVNSAITTALRTAAAPVGPPSMVVTAIRAEVRKRLTELADRVRRSLPPPPRISPVARPSRPERSTSLRATLGHRRGNVLTAPKAAAAADPIGQTDPDQKKTTAVNGATDLTDGNKAVPSNKKSPQAQLRQRAEVSLNQARTSLERLGDVLRKAVPPPPKLPKMPSPHRAKRH